VNSSTARRNARGSIAGKRYKRGSIAAKCRARCFARLRTQPMQQLADPRRVYGAAHSSARSKLVSRRMSALKRE
jgi:hypothetical protein